VTDALVPSDDDLEVALSARRTIEERIGYVKALFDPLRDHARMRANYEAEIQSLQVSRDGMREELRNLRIKLGDLADGDRAALDQRYDMLSKIKRARGEVPALRQQTNAVFDRLEEALKE
jgi:SMC interacting uncharacterized protein involved in chromosome segregation